MKIDVETPGNDSYAVLYDRLIQWNRRMSPWAEDIFTVVARTADGVLIGGMRGIVNMGLVEIRGVWVEPSYREAGLGRRLMTTLEDRARSRGATRSALWTYDWEARGFYEKLGYEIYGTLPYPAGTTRYFMKKDLPPAP